MSHAAARHAGPGLHLVREAAPTPAAPRAPARQEYDDLGDYVPTPAFYAARDVEMPQEIAERQAREARGYLEQVRSGKNLRFPWTDLDRLLGPLLPGWLVFIGGRGKGGKTTMLRELFTAWIELGRTVVYVGTETEAPVLRLAWAAVRLGLSVEEVLSPTCPVALYERCMADVERQQTTFDLANRAIFADTGKATLAEIAYWIEYARIAKADALIFDHLGQLATSGGDRWSQFADAIHEFKRLAVAARMTLVVGAQLKQGDGGSFLGEHDVPGNHSWAASAEVQRTADVAIQLWRPFRNGVTAEQKRDARDDATKIPDLIQPNTMAIRVAAHRYRGSAMNACAKLYVTNDQLSSWSPR